MIWMIGGDGVGKLTQNAGTRIQALLGGLGGLFTHLVNFRYTDTGTAHTITIMRGHPAGRVSVATTAIAAATALIVSAAPAKSDATAPANLDSIGIRLDNGQWHLTTISAWNAGTLTFTLNTAIPTGRRALKGASVVLYGVAADTFHSTTQFTAGAGSSAVNFPPASTPDVSLVRSYRQGEPLLFDSNNATNAGTLNQANLGYAKR